MSKAFIFISVLILVAGCVNEKHQAEKILQHYIDHKVEMIRNYSKESAVALWNATLSGNETDYQKLIDIELDFNKSNQKASDYFMPDRFFPITQNVFANEQDFQLLKRLKFSGLITDTLQKRQLDVLYHAFMGPQIKPDKYKKLITTEINLSQTYSTLKIDVNGKKYCMSQIDSLKSNSTEDLLWKQIFYGTREKGRLLAPDILKMVKERNEFASNFGYSNYYQLMLEEKDQTPEEVKFLLGEIERKTREPYFKAKKVIDNLLAQRFHIQPEALNAWNYNDDRSSYLPEKYTQIMDSLFRNTNPVQKTSSFFDSVGLPIQKVIENSDLEYRKGKPSITGMVNVDFKNDIRLIASIQNTHMGMIRMMHLGGHASHYTNISDDVPFLLKTPNSLLGEGVARYFESLASDFGWLKEVISFNSKIQKQCIAVCHHLRQIDRLFRCRNYLVMAEFEREVYQKPDQNLDSLWYSLNLKYLGVRLPEIRNACFWAASKYSTGFSCTIHNFLLADVFAAQLQHSIKINVFNKPGMNCYNNKAVGKYLTDNLYRYGNLLPWNQLIQRATGEPLNIDYFVEQLVED